uniref:Uncharacterized protein n=1 Tax=Panagrolaimus sp. PS1159 TaxID=55785 RepID=A0AC35GEI3_9BILA
MDTFGRKFVAVYFRAGIGFLSVIFLLFGKLFLSIESFAIGTVLFGALWPIKSGVTKYYISECSPDKIRGLFTQGLVSITESVTNGYDLERSIIHTKSNHINLRQIWEDNGLRSSLILTFVTMLVNLVGPLQIYFVYSITLKIKYGFTNSQAVTFELFLNLACLPLGYILPFLYEKIGRRPIFLFTVFLSCLIADLLPAPAKSTVTQAMMLTTSILGIAFNFLFSFLQPLLGFCYFLPIIFIQFFFFYYLFKNLPETRFKAVYQNFEELQSVIHSRRNTNILLTRSRVNSLLRKPQKHSLYSYGTV